MGLTSSSVLLGLSPEEFASLSAEQREAAIDPVRNAFLDAGAHGVMDSLSEVAELLRELNKLLDVGDRP